MERNLQVSAWWHQFLFQDGELTGAQQINKTDRRLASAAFEEARGPVNTDANNSPVDQTILLEKLQLLFGEGSRFRSPRQLEMVFRSVVAKDDMVVMMPTGHGKSLTYILPALVDPDATSVVFCPLVSLLFR